MFIIKNVITVPKIPYLEINKIAIGKFSPIAIKVNYDLILWKPVIVRRVEFGRTLSLR